MSGNQKHKSTSYEKRAAYPPGGVPPPGKNRLVFEKSPYLLQHAENAVDWYPWGNEAFAKARAENKPVFLSIGYSTCHWCHVMERESFEDPEVAALLNDVFVCIKVDREERPDIDNVYMTVCQMLTGRGGWPLTIMMAPDKRPFFAATYLPKPAMMNMIPSVKAAWTNNRSRIFADAGRLLEALERETSHPAGGVVGRKETDDAYEQLAGRFDGDYGGFGGAPKFPTPHNLLFLLRCWKRTSDGRALHMVEKTLEKMRRGGVYDHVGFGFHRYSTDARWFLPHFEKMLYDQALLAMAYTEAYQATSKAEYAQTAREIFTYVLRDMTSDGGAFCSAEDADSEGEEGKFYLWTRSELDDVLGAEDGELAAAFYGVEPSGNWTEEATGHRPGTNILHVEKTTTERAQIFGVEESRLRERLEDIRRKLFAAREERAHPHKDDKILTDWNALMIAALAKASRAFGDPGLARSAKSAAEFILREMKNPRGGLFHRYRDGEASIAAMADDYAFWVWALLELYETTFDVSYLKEAIATNDYFLKHFWDEQDGGFFFTSDEGETLIVRSKEVYDGAIPSANSVAKMNLVRIGRMTGESKYEARAVGIGRAFHARLSAQASAFTMMMSAVEFVTGPSCEVVIVGGPKDEDTQAMAAALEKTYVPNKVVILRPAGDGGKDIVALAPFTKSLSAVDGKATAYVCRNHTCELPTTDVYKMIQLLDDTVD